MKYILLAMGILLALFGDIIEKEKKNNSTRGIKFKKITSFGWILIISSMVLAALGIIQTFNDENIAKKLSAEKNLDDSIALSNKNKNDSIRFMSIIDKIAYSQNAVLEKSNEIVTTTLKETDKILVNNKNNNFSIPEEFIINFELELLINEDLQSIEKELKKVYNWNSSGDKNYGFSLNYNFKNIFKSPTLNALHNFDNGVFDIGIDFFDNKEKQLLSLIDLNKTSLQNSRTHKFKDPMGYQNKFYTFYYCNQRKIKIAGHQIQIGVDKNIYCKSLLELGSKKMKVRFYVGAITNDNSIFEQFNVKLNRLSISTKDGLTINVEKFNQKTNNVFECILKSTPWN